MPRQRVCRGGSDWPPFVSAPLGACRDSGGASSSRSDLATALGLMESFPLATRGLTLSPWPKTGLRMWTARRLLLDGTAPFPSHSA